MLRFIVLLAYVGLLIFLQQYLKRRPPQLSPQYVEPEVRPLIAMFWMFGPSLLPLLGLLWSGITVGNVSRLLGIIPITPMLLFLLAFCVPVFIYSLFFTWTKVFNPVDVLPYTVFCGFGILLCSLPLLGAERGLIVVLLCLFSLALPPIFTILLLLLWGPEMLPLDEEQKKDRRTAMAFFISFFTTYPKPTLAIVKDTSETRIPGNPFHGSGPGMVLTEAHNAVVIKDSASIKSVSGPGTIFTQANEQIHSVIDLRQQIRGKRVQAQTRDGIKVDMPIASIFRIHSGGRKPQLDQPWPFNKQDAYKAIFAAEVNPAGKTPLDAHQARPWEELSLQIAEHTLRQVVARYSLDELYGAVGAEERTLPRLDVGKTVRAQVITVVEPKGIKIEGGGIGNKILPLDKQVTKQRIESWKAAWISKVMENSGRASANRVLQHARVRADVRAELLQGLVDQSQKLQEAGPHASATLLTLQLLETLEHIAHDPKVGPLLPESAELTLKGLRMQLQASEERNS